MRLGDHSACGCAIAARCAAFAVGGVSKLMGGSKKDGWNDACALLSNGAVRSRAKEVSALVSEMADMSRAYISRLIAEGRAGISPCGPIVLLNRGQSAEQVVERTGFAIYVAAQ